MTVQFNTAEGVALEKIHNAMLDAFSDYDIPLKMSFEQFEQSLRSRQFVPNLSYLAWEDEEILSFWIVGRRGDCGHLAMSGTRPKARGKGYANTLGTQSERAMKDAGLSNFQFEVLTTNKRAIKLYEKLGHTAQREFDCFRFAPPACEPSELFSISSENWADVCDEIQTFKDVKPSWQADDDAIEALGEAVLIRTMRVNNKIVAYLAATPTGSILQLAVAPKQRRQGIAKLLLARFAKEHVIENYSYVNIDSNDENTQKLMKALDAKNVAKQFEMHKSLKPVENLVV